jgi:cell division protease FtsH
MKVRNMVQSMVLRFGMSDLFPNYAPTQTEGQNIYSEETAAKIDEEVKRIIQECTVLTEKKVKLYKDKIEKLAKAVLLKESLNHQ